MSAQKPGPAPLVQFAQKATAIVKAAGFDPKTIDLETFRRLAPIIFTRAYCAIYKEQLISDINEYSNREEQILNSQLVIDGLTAKTRNPALATISGIDIFQGNHRAVGILAGVLFAEGQRLWMEKVKVHGQTPVKAGGMSDSPPKPDQEAEELDHEEEKRQLEDLKNNSNVPPHELEKLLNRIAYLEDRLSKRTKRRSRSKSRSKSPTSRERRSSSPETRTKIANNNFPQITPGARRDGHDDTSDISEDDAISVGDNGSEPPLLRPRSSSARRHHARPSSAPSRRRVKEVSNRLYNAPLNKQVMELAQAPPHQPKPPVVNPLFTYDIKSGRRILVSQAEHQRELREQAKKAMGNLTHITRDEDDFMAGAPEHPKLTSNKPAAPEYPCKRIEAAVEEWVKKNRQVAGVDKPTAEMPAPRQLNVYHAMEALDIIFTIEHCHNCEHHQITTRHKPQEYRKQADEFLRVLAQTALQAGLCVRVGVARFEAEITCKSKTTDENSRIGAFEVQVALKNGHGSQSTAMLHSKLFSGRWPSKSVLEKRFHTFLAKQTLPSYAYAADGQTEYDMEITRDGQNYPVGRCTFNDTPLADPAWSFATFQASSTAGVMWTFDARSLQHLPKFSLQSLVLVRNVAYQPGQVEKYPLVGVVKRYEATAGDGAAAASRRQLYVQLKYHQSDTRVLESDCSPYADDANEKPLSCDAGKLPLDLEGLLMLARRDAADGRIAWQISDEEDRPSPGGLLLTRRSFYHQLRKLCWTLVAKRQPHPLIHPLTSRLLDPPMCYSERMMNKLLELFGNQVDTAALEACLPLDPKLAAANKPTATAAVAATPAATAVAASPVAPAVAATPAAPATSTVAAVPASTNGGSTGAASGSGGASPAATPAETRTSPRSRSSSPRTLTTSTSITAAAAQDFAAIAAAAAAAADEGNATAPSTAAADGATPVATAAAVVASDGGVSPRTAEAAAAGRKSRRPTLSTKPPIQQLHDLDTRFHQTLRLPAAHAAADVSVAEAFLRDINAVAVEGLVRLEDVIRLLYDYGGEQIADSAQDMKVLACYLSRDEEDMSSELLVAKLAEWLRGQFLYPTEHTDQLPSPAATAPETASATTTASASTTAAKKPPTNASSSSSSSSSSPNTRAMLQLPPGAGGVLTPLSSRRSTAIHGLAPIPETPTRLAAAGAAGGNGAAGGVPSTESADYEDGGDGGDGGGVVVGLPTDEAAAPEVATATTATDSSPRAAAATAAAVVQPEIAYQNRDVVINNIVLDGVALQHPAYDSVYVAFDLDGQHADATVCLAREKGSKKRTFNASSWPELAFSAGQFREKNVFVSVIVADTTLQATFPQLPTVASTVLGVSPQSAAIPARNFYAATFSLTATVVVPVLTPTSLAGGSGANTPSAASLSTPTAAGAAAATAAAAAAEEPGRITITIHGLSREAKEARMNRILSMKPVDLLNLKFEPVAFDDDDDHSDDDDASQQSGAVSLHSKRSLSRHHAAHQAHQRSTEGLEFSHDESLNQTLFPAASYNNLLSPVKGLSTNPSGASLPTTTED